MDRMYGHRAFELVTVSINEPDERAGVLAALQKLHATSNRLMMGSTDVYALMGGVRFRVERGRALYQLIRPDASVAYKASAGNQFAGIATIDHCESRRR